MLADWRFVWTATTVLVARHCGGALGFASAFVFAFAFAFAFTFAFAFAFAFAPHL